MTLLTGHFGPLLVLLVALVLSGSTPSAALAHGDEPDTRTIVVTTEILGAVVSEVAGDVADMHVLMPPGADPHSWEPSARDVEALLGADLVVANGLDLEAGLRAVLEVARADGVPVFEAAAHVERPDLGVGADEHTDEAPAGDGVDGEPDHEHDGALDPHIWTDPLAMRDVVVALEATLAELGLDVAARAAEERAVLETLDAEVRDILSVVAPEDRVLVTGHRSLGYFAERYGFELLGTVIPGLSTDGEPSARELAGLISDIRDAGVTTVFAEVGTPASVARAVADDSGAHIVELSTSQLPADGTYADFIRTLALTIAEALAR